MLAFGFAKLALRRIGPTRDLDDRGSAHVLQKFGVTCEGRMRAYFHVRGEWRDRLMRAVLRD